MARTKTIHQIMPGFLYGDALGNQAYRIRDLLRRWGYRSQVYAQFRDSRLADPGLEYTRYRGDPDNVLIFHYSIGSPVTEFVRQLPDRVVLYYHNVTPAEYLTGYNSEMAQLLGQGRRELTLFADSAYALAASGFNRQELAEVGFRHVDVLPYFVYFDELFDSSMSESGCDVVKRFDDGWVNLLFVGRLVPNKRQDDLIRLFNYYHKLVNPKSRLMLIGSDSNAPGYRLELEALIEALDLDNVLLPGPIGLQEGLGGYYRAATAFVSMSEHEGFCVPLLEAMAFEKPVIAFRATGVPYALGEAGVLFNAKRYDVIGELIQLLVDDEHLCRQVVARQRQHLLHFQPNLVAQRLESCIKQLLD
ncbi:MAG: glycosyltransferase family 4 protein [Chloroflexi bacterium]|nr:glycosyltransferase family 4 protein [Chloroflexota bacterium]